MHLDETNLDETTLPPDDIDASLASDLPCVFPPMVAIWNEAHILYKRAGSLTALLASNLHAGDASILPKHDKDDDVRAFLVGVTEKGTGGWMLQDTVRYYSPTEVLLSAAQLEELEAAGLKIVDDDDDDRTEELPQAGRSVLQAMGAANNFVELFDEVRDCALGAVTWHNIGRPDPWDGTQPELLALWTQFADTACRKGPYAACRTFSTLPPHDGWPDFTGDPDPAPLAPTEDGLPERWFYVSGEPDPTPPAPTEQHMPLNSSPPAPPV